MSEPEGAPDASKAPPPEGGASPSTPPKAAASGEAGGQPQGAAGRSPLALVAVLLTVGVALSSLHLAVSAIQNLVELGPVVTSPPPKGVDMSGPNQRFGLSLLGLAVMAVLALLLAKTALALLQQKREALLGGVILAAVAILFPVFLFNLAVASLAARGALSGLLIVLLLLPPNLAYFHREGQVYRKPKTAAPLLPPAAPSSQAAPPVSQAPAQGSPQVYAPPPVLQATHILCPGCRSTVPSEFIFCTRCGADLRIQAPAQAPPVQPPAAPMGAPGRLAMPGKRFCIQCGKPNSVAVLYCTDCGAKLG